MTDSRARKGVSAPAQPQGGIPAAGGTLAFFVSGKPRAQARARMFHVGKKSVLWSPKTEFYHAIMAEAMKVGGNKKWTGPISLELDFVFESRRRTGWHIFRPDMDNLEKAVKDAITKSGLWKDDCLVCRCVKQKRYGFPAGVYVTVSKIPVPQ